MSRARDIADFLPAGGTTGQALVKASSADYDYTYAVDSLPPIPPGTLIGTALVVDAQGVAVWGAPIVSDDQNIDGGGA